jgi:hypothetical protein
MFDNFPLWPASASTQSLPVDLLYIFLIVISAVATFGIAAILIFGIVPAPWPRSRADRSSLIWKLGQLFRSAFLWWAVWGAVLFFDLRTPPRDSTEICAVGKRWMKLQHTRRARNQPAARPSTDIKLIMTTGRHPGFFVPAFRIKQDVPRPLHHSVFRATTPVLIIFLLAVLRDLHSGMIMTSTS